MNPTETRWIALDWGTSTLRAWAMSARHTVLDKASSTQGMATVAAKNGDFESALLKLITPWLPNGRTTQVIACGMV
ncbi:MAG: 2-dehydro-3-deoxygalactonokinase, partial [Verrucomicrobiales bacterium]|nr:2-dehydro-3-deoxygalactonokinase [Verrucomicrobiales bacterium]